MMPLKPYLRLEGFSREYRHILVYGESMQKTITILKVVGETPLQALERARQAHGIAPEVPMTYAGRLDPMAQGKLLLLVGDECKKQSTYHGLDKEYRFEILFGLQSDTGDIMGMPEAGPEVPVTLSALQKIVRTLQGDIALPYPHFSSKTVHGKPLFLWTLEGRLGEIEVPVATTTIYKLRALKVRTLKGAELKREILTRIRSLPTVTEESKRLGEDFRRTDIIPAWQTLLVEDRDYMIASFRATVSAGTYIRSLAPKIAKLMGTTGLAYSIDRINLGIFVPLPLLGGFWKKLYR